ncbi:MAG TPA: L,D-transpeptidase [Solirubrobacterales bacterium]|nr:L,D-transpeptidase [Solirubrobacterales bacterium]
MIRRFSSLLVVAAALALPASAAAAPAKPAPKPAPVPEAVVKIKVGKLENGRAQIMQTVPVTGTLAPYVPGEKVKVNFYLDGRRLFSRSLETRKSGGKGTFRTKIRITENGKYAVSAKHVATPRLGADSTVRKSWKVSFTALRRGQCGDVVVGFKKAMRKMGYITNDGRCFGGKTARGVLAYRKVNGMSRTMRAGKGLVKKVFSGKGGYEVRHPGAGDHLEAPLSKQVLVFAKGDEPYAIYPISSGKSSTPTVTGHYEMIRTEPGMNSHGMYYSWYFYGGYAVHGYNSVPDYPASHGCLRTFMSDQPEIYNRIFYGQDIFIW